MATFLSTGKMAPELRARVEASVSGRRGSSGSRLTPRAVMCLRAVAATTVLACVVSIGLSMRRAEDALASERSAILDRWKQETSGLTPRDRGIMLRVGPWVRRAAGDYEGDAIDTSLKGESVLNELLRQPLVYVRGPLDRLRTPKGLEETALDSSIDAFALCLLDPPKARSELWLVRRVRSAYSSDGRMRESTARVARLGAAVVGLPFFDEAWARRVQNAEDPKELAALRRNLERAPLRAAKDAAKATLLLAVLDEPGSREIPAELDGERPHDVRVLLVDLVASKTLIRLRRRVDPNWISEGTRAEFASGVDSCALALDVRAALSPPPAGSASAQRPARP